MTHENSSPRWRLLAIILGLGLLAEIIVWTQNSDDVSQQVIFTWIVILVTALLVLFWWLFLSRLPWKTRLAGLLVPVLAGVLFLGAFRYEGLAGDFAPRFSFRFGGSGAEAPSGVSKGTASVEASADGRLEVAQGDWPGFRGPERDGRALDEVVRSDWAENPPQALWRRPIGEGWSSFAAVGDLLFTQEQRGEEEWVVALEAETGEVVWSHANAVRHETFLGGIGPRATPEIHDGRLYALGATGILDCLDPLTGEVIWSRDIVEDAGTQILEFGFAGSPLIYDDKVVVNPGKNVAQGEDPSIYEGTTPGALIAYDRVTGEILWRTGQRQAGYTAPRLEEVGGERQILLFSAYGLAGHDPETGEELWWFEWINPYGTNSVQPIVAPDGGLFVTTEATGSALLDVSRSGDSWTITPRWETSRFKLRYNGAVEKDGFVYGLDGGRLAALDLKSGERTWKKGRYRFGQILLLRDHLLVLAESGDVVLTTISPEGMEEVGRFHAIDGRCWNHPVVHEGVLYVRSDQEAAAYDLRVL